MKILIATDIRINEYDGKIFSGASFAKVLKRYVDIFGEVVLCARIKNGNSSSEKMTDITNLVKNTIKLKSLADVCKPGIMKILEGQIKESDLIVARVPSFSGFVAAGIASKYKKPYYTESMGCAWDAYWNHGIAGKLIAPYMFFKMKQVVKNADYALYVTSEFLQKRYPCKNESIAASNVLIKEVLPEVLEKRLQKTFNKKTDTLVLMTTAGIGVKYKGQEYVIRAIPALNKEGIRVKYVLVGGGDRTYLEKVAEDCGVKEQIEFTGALSRDEVIEKLDKSDIYIQPSLQEGLPRAVIEAMSRALPVIGAKTAGIPELINDKWVVKRKSHTDIAEKIIDMIKDDNMQIAAKENFEESKKYLKEVLDERRNKYFDKIREEIL